jgi:hypothetical protein
MRREMVDRSVLPVDRVLSGALFAFPDLVGAETDACSEHDGRQFYD